MSFLSDVHVPYKRDVGEPMPLLKKHRKAALLSEWVQTAAALSQTRKKSVDERLMWFKMANRYMAADRVSDYPCPRTKKLILCKQAARSYATLCAEIDEMTYGRRRRQ